jgi:peptidoglycan/LPS O-acetylase OafA/YrhL
MQHQTIITRFVIPSEKGKRLKELDILRAVAVFLVLGRHLLEIPETLSPSLRMFLLVWREVGWIGVDLFFVLSGFLVAGILFREYQSNQRVHITRFLIRRGFKIYPPFYALIAVTFVLSDLLPIPHEKWRYIGELLFLQNYLGSVWNQTWSLAVEEHFYLLLAIVVFLLARTNQGDINPFRFLLTFILSTMALVLILRCIVGGLYPVGEWGPIIVYTHFRIDSLLFGVMLAYLFYFKSSVLKSITQRFERTLLWVALCLISLPSLFPLSESRVSYTLGFTGLYLGFGAILMIMLLSRSKIKELIVNICAPVLIPVGRASYSIYLWHMLVYYLSNFITGGAEPSTLSFLLHLAAYIIGSILIGMIMSRLIETPSLALRDKLYPHTELRPAVPDAVGDCATSDSSDVARDETEFRSRR